MTHLSSTDLVALAEDNRRSLRPLDETLRRMGPQPSAGLPASAAVALMAMSRVYAQRVARTASAATALVLTIGLVVICYPFQRFVYWEPGQMRDDDYFLERSPFQFAKFVFVIALAVHIITAGLAHARFERQTRAASSPIDRASALVRNLDGVSVASWLLGTTTFVATMGMLWFALGDAQLVQFNRWDGQLGQLLTVRGLQSEVIGDQLVPLEIVLDVVVVVALALGRACHKGAVRGSRLLVPLGVLIGVATLYVGFAFDVGVIWVSQQTQVMPSLELRTMLTITGTAAVMLVLTGLALWRRRDENERCGL
ncbi:MAG: hypothetical protein ABI867_11305 [Kofleriaceae bacterium]